MARRKQVRPPGYWKQVNDRRDLYRREYYKNNREKLIAGKKAWVEKNKEYHEEYLQNYRDTHKEIIKKRAQDWRKKNPHQVVAYACKRRKRIEAAQSDNEVGILEFYKLARAGIKKTCYYRERIFRGVADVDHIVPLTRGGKHSSDNLCLSCPTCNRKKHTKIPSEFTPASGQMIFDV